MATLSDLWAAENAPGGAVIMDLFSYEPEQPKYPNAPGFVRGSDTSEAAAKSISRKALNKMQLNVHWYISGQEDGVTCDDIELALEMKHQTCSARVRELAVKGLIVDTGERRNTSSGRSARVYKAVRS